MTTSPETRFLQRPSQGNIAYDIAGEGPVALLVPGMGDLRSTYRFLAPTLIAAGHTVVTTDLRGHGDSDATFTSYGDTQTADDIAALLHELQRPAVVVGSSMAAGAAVIAAAQHPELIRGLVLVGPFVRNPAINPAMQFLFRLMMARPWVVPMWNAYLPTLYAGAKPSDFAAHRKSIVASMRRPGYARAFSQTTRTSHTPAQASLAAVNTPTLVIMGEGDPDFPNPHTEATWVAQELDGNVVMIPDAGHYPHSQQPTLTGQAIVEFLNTLENHA